MNFDTSFSFLWYTPSDFLSFKVFFYYLSSLSIFSLLSLSSFRSNKEKIQKKNFERFQRTQKDNFNPNAIPTPSKIHHKFPQKLWLNSFFFSFFSILPKSEEKFVSLLTEKCIMLLLFLLFLKNWQKIITQEREHFASYFCQTTDTLYISLDIHKFYFHFIFYSSKKAATTMCQSTTKKKWYEMNVLLFYVFYIL